MKAVWAGQAVYAQVAGTRDTIYGSEAQSNGRFHYGVVKVQKIFDQIDAAVSQRRAAQRTSTAMRVAGNGSREPPATLRLLPRSSPAERPLSQDPLMRSSLSGWVTRRRRTAPGNQP